MSDFNIQGFTYDNFTGADGVKFNVAHAGEGSPVIPLHGFPQTHLMWNAVVQDLRRDHAVIALDLRG
ncbi:alpha/beta fold hydrolase [Kordiimonas sp.]|uniref:alpha/beta fold hydrolase n=1 Tax=Kordiimonas sp. TaxID=1970157 RepID=UPI003A8F65F0